MIELGILTLIQAIVSWVLVGLILVIQWVHYPSFKYLEPGAVTPFKDHQTRISYIVIPLMFVELLTGGLLAWQYPSLIHGLNLGLMAVIWLHTFTIMVPLHQKLASGQSSPSTIDQLTKTNRIRTIIWVLKAILWAIIIWPTMPS